MEINSSEIGLETNSETISDSPIVVDRLHKTQLSFKSSVGRLLKIPVNSSKHVDRLTNISSLLACLNIRCRPCLDACRLRCLSTTAIAFVDSRLSSPMSNELKKTLLVRFYTLSPHINVSFGVNCFINDDLLTK